MDQIAREVVNLTTRLAKKRVAVYEDATGFPTASKKAPCMSMLSGIA